MGKRKSVQIPVVSKDRLKWLEEAMNIVEGDLGRARKNSSWSAVAALHRQLQSLRAEYDAEVERLKKETEEPEEDPRDRTPAEVEAEESQRATTLHTAHLQIYVAEYLRRTPTVKLVTTDGTTIEFMRKTG